jgi:hypothetical protein
VRIEQTGQAGGNPVAAKGVDFTYNPAGQIATIAGCHFPERASVVKCRLVDFLLYAPRWA